MKLNRIMSKSLWFLCLVVWACSLSLSAQTPSGGSTLRGIVEDELGGILPGAKVTIVLPGGKTRIVTTAADGSFSIPNVNAGVYNFFVQIKGFQPHVVSDLKVPHDDAMKITLLPASVEEATDIVAEAAGVSVEPDQNLTATVLGEDFIKDLPNNEDDMLEVLQALAGPGASASGGGAEIMVNGFRGGRLPPKEAILRISINQNPYSAEFSQPGFGRIEIVTKPGNDTWRGSVGADFRNSALDARNAFALVKPDLAQQQFRFNLSGPIIKKKMSFFLNMERRNLSGGSTTTYINPLGRFSENVLAPNDNLGFNIRADYLINQKNTMGVSYNRQQRNSQNQEFAVSFNGGFGGFGGPGGGRGGGGGGAAGGGGGASGTVNFTLPERGTNSDNQGNDLQIMNTTIISSRLINEARLRMGYDTRHTTPVSTGVAINVLDAFNGGGSPTGITNTRGFDYELQDYLTYTLKKHTLKGGVQVAYVNQYSYSLSNFNGTYTFPSIGEYCKNPNVGVTCVGALSNSARGRYQFTLSTGDPTLRYSQTEYSMFVNDDWRFSQKFTLSLGVRSEFQNNLGDKNNFAPRLGIAWSPFKDRKTTFRFGSGIFYQRLSENMYAQVLRFNGTTQKSYVIENPVFKPNFKPGDDLSLIGTAAQIQNSTVRIFDQNLVAPVQYNFNGSVERQLPLGLNASVNFIYSRGTNLFRTRNTNAQRLDRAACAPVPLPGQLPNLNCTRPDSTRGEIYQIETAANSEFKSLQVRIDRRMSRRFSFFGNYSYSSAKNNASTPADNYNLAGEWSRSFGGHQASLMGRLTLPKGISLSPMIMLRTGNPYNILLGQDLNRDNDFGDRPAGIARNSDLPASLYSQVVGCRSGQLNTCIGGQSLADFLRQTYPNGVKAIGPGSVGMNLNISKSFGFGKRDNANANAGGPGGGMGGGRGGGGGGRDGGGMRGGGGPGGFGGGPGGMMGGGGAEGSRYTLQLSAQISNLLNHVNFGQYSGTLTSPYFGLPNSAAAGRQFELGMRFMF